MATTASESGMLANQRVTCLSMVEALTTGFPMDKVEVFTIMLCVTAATILAALSFIYHTCVVSSIFI